MMLENCLWAGWLAGVGPVSTSTLEQGIVKVVGDPPERSIWYLGWGKGWILDPEAGCLTRQYKTFVAVKDFFF